MTEAADRENLFPDIENRLRDLATPLDEPQPGDWLFDHPEKGQTFRRYRSANPVRRDKERTCIYLCLIGEFDEPQQRVLDRTGEYLGLFFDVAVQVRCRVPLSDIPPHARRTHPDWGDKQLLSTWILHDLLEPSLPFDDALAYLALTARDLWPGDGWNFVFGQANLRRRVGVFSIHRNGYPGKNEKAFRLCLRRTLMTATHETGHILTMRHCTAFHCLMNGANSQDERDRKPLHLCPVCLRKLLWNLQVEPVPYLERLADWCAEHKLQEGEWYRRAACALTDGLR